MVLGFCNSWSKDFIIHIRFFVEKKEIQIDADFSVIFLALDSNKKVLIKPLIKNNSFVFPDLCTYKIDEIVFKYKNKAYAINASDNEMVNYDDSEWIIYFDKKPYNRDYHFGDEMHKKKYEGIILVKHHKKNSETFIHVFYLENTNLYIKESKALLD